jgi:hypothetical protein
MHFFRIYIVLILWKIKLSTNVKSYSVPLVLLKMDSFLHLQKAWRKYFFLTYTSSKYIIKQVSFMQKLTNVEAIC